MTPAEAISAERLVEGVPNAANLREGCERFSAEQFNHALRRVESVTHPEARERVTTQLELYRGQRLQRDEAALFEAKRSADASVGAYRLNRWILGFTIAATVLSAVGIIATLRASK